MRTFQEESTIACTRDAKASASDGLAPANQLSPTNVKVCPDNSYTESSETFDQEHPQNCVTRKRGSRIWWT
ncbi:hypothetical protein SAY87_003810 [Trapa incisa]|uniref:Uncharacterized protein n=1 Tax=Trapa incisa TaxID=236973 RepID=A0AAN7KJR5_9MYRT|nr:hypothetical protein SAY87_003810 [Trapa incisa]